MSPRSPAGLLLVAILVAACRPTPPRGAPAADPPVPAADALELEARRHLGEAERLLCAADAKRDDGDARLGASAVAVVRDVYVEAGRLYEASSEERNRAYAAAAAARDAWAAEAHAKCRARRASAEEAAAPGR